MDFTRLFKLYLDRIYSIAFKITHSATVAEEIVQAIKRQISRRYGVEIGYAGEVPENRFEGKISREAKLGDVLKILEFSNVKFTLEGPKIVVQ